LPLVAVENVTSPVSPLANWRSRNKRPGGQPRLVGSISSDVGGPPFTKGCSMLAAAVPAAHFRPPQPGRQSSCGDWVIKVCALGSTTLVTPWRQNSAQSRGPPPLPCPNLWVPWCSCPWRGCGVLTVSQSTRCLPLEAVDLESLLFLLPRAKGVSDDPLRVLLLPDATRWNPRRPWRKHHDARVESYPCHVHDVAYHAPILPQTREQAW
jgi:hypothetical protein